MTAITYLQTMPERVLVWRLNRKYHKGWAEYGPSPKGYVGRRRNTGRHEGATVDWSPTGTYTQVEPQLPDVELVKRSEDDLIVHNILNEITDEFRIRLDNLCSAAIDRICAGDPTSIHRALVASDMTQEIDMRAFRRELVAASAAGLAA